MKIIKYLSLALILIIGVSQCKLPDNIDPKHPTEVPYYTLFSNALDNMVRQTESTSVNNNIQRLTVQFWQETTYFDESRYNYQDRQIPDGFASRFYKDALMDFQEARKILTDENYGGDPDVTLNELAIIDICEVYTYQLIVDVWGDMPYTYALQGPENTSPAYDDDAAIYADLIKRLRNDLASLNTGVGGAFAGKDMMYNGDAAAWKKFGASLLLRVGIRLSDVDAAAAKTAVADAVAAGVFTAQSESAFLFYPGVVPHVNEINDAFRQGRKDFLPTHTLINMMTAMDDPRMNLCFIPITFAYTTDEDGNKLATTLEPQVAGLAQQVILMYADGNVKVDLPFTAELADTLNLFDYHWGAIAGLDGAQSYNNYSNFSDRTMDPAFEANMMDFVEVEFLLAEAAQRGFAVSGSAEDHYNAAITASILYWWGSADAAADYLAANPYDGTNWKKSIGEQKWLALYNHGIEAFSEWRRLDYPILNAPEGMEYSDIPLRMPYPYNEILENTANYEAAAAAIGGDLTSTPVFWDVVPSPAAK